MRFAPALVLATLTLTACSAMSAGQSETPPGLDLPPRSQTIHIDGLNPCSVFTSAQLEILDVGGERFTPADARGGPICQWSHGPAEPIEGYLVQVRTDQGPETAFGNPNGTTVSTISGFPTVETQGLGGGGDDHCVILVGVADGQTLQVQYDYTGTEIAMTRAKACDEARMAAEMAMETLIDRAGGGR